jgi:prepilin-type N-terminal cleavage/methylation domain-containing protein
VFERYREIQLRSETGDSESGFTLIELLIVIIVLGILAAIVIFSLTGVTGQSEVAACNSDAKTVQTSVAAYQAENPGALPAGFGFGNLTGTVPDPSGHGPYLHAAPTATLGKNGYQVTLDATTLGQVDVQTNGGGPTPYDTGGQALCNAIP